MLVKMGMDVVVDRVSPNRPIRPARSNRDRGRDSGASSAEGQVLSAIQHIVVAW
jgi:hypothetical protein